MRVDEYQVTNDGITSLPVRLTNNAGTVLQTATTAVESGATITASGTSATFDTTAAHDVEVLVNVSAASGTSPSLTVSLQTSPDGGTTWITVGSLAAITAAGSAIKSFTAQAGLGFATLCRLSFAVTGTTPSFTASVWAVTRP